LLIIEDKKHQSKHDQLKLDVLASAINPESLQKVKSKSPKDDLYNILQLGGDKLETTLHENHPEMTSKDTNFDSDMDNIDVLI